MGCELKRQDADFAKAMADQKIIIGRIYLADESPRHSGTAQEVAKFTQAVAKIMT